MITLPSRLAAGFCAIALLALVTPPSTLSAQQKNRNKKATLPLAEIVLTEKGLSPYRIVLPSAATAHEEKAAGILQKYLLEISGAALPILNAEQHRSKYEILLGQNDRLDDLGAGIDFNALGEDGFTIKTDSLRLIIAGGSDRGTLYGVYTFLENYLGCRMYSPSVKVIPKIDRITLGKTNDTQIPAIGFRDTHYRVTWDAEYTDWHKLDHDESGRRTDWGMWVHTFNALVPPEIHYDEHPEYYAMVKGKRIPTQLCLTNHDVLRITVQNLRKMIAKQPNARYWSVSQNDNREYCTCENCKAIDDREGSPSGSIISFVNLVADNFVSATLAGNE